MCSLQQALLAITLKNPALTVLSVGHWADPLGQSPFYLHFLI